MRQLPRLTLVLGGARSGKSRLAEGLFAGEATYLATCRRLSDDAEMAARIREHEARRGERWRTVEEPLDLAGALARVGGPVLVDCLTLWLTNVLLDETRDTAAEIDRLAETLPGLTGPVVFVANEVGLGLVPETSLGRAFRDHAGLLNQRIALAADRVLFVAAGLPLTLKDAQDA